MAFIEWHEEYSVGIDSIDAEHKVMVGMISTLHESMCSGQANDKVLEILDGLIAYTYRHFSLEEELFLKTGYSGAVKHRYQHERLKKQVQEYRTRASFAIGSALVLDLSAFLYDWLITHIRKDDMRYSAHFIAKGIV